MIEADLAAKTFSWFRNLSRLDDDGRDRFGDPTDSFANPADGHPALAGGLHASQPQLLSGFALDP